MEIWPQVVILGTLQGILCSTLSKAGVFPHQSRLATAIYHTGFLNHAS